MSNLFQADWWRNFYGRLTGKLSLEQALILLAIGFVVAWSLKGAPATTSTGDRGDAHD